MRLIDKKLVLVILISSFLNGCGSSNGSISLSEPPSVSDNADLKGPQAVRYVKASISIGGETLGIENLGWCEPEENLKRNNQLKCKKLNDYTKLNWKNKDFYIYRTVNNFIFEGDETNLSDIHSESSFASKQVDESPWEEHKGLIAIAKSFYLNDDINVNLWKRNLSIEHRLYTSRCRSSKYSKIISDLQPEKQGNRLLDSAGIFYLDNILDSKTTFIEYDLYKNNILGIAVSDQIHRTANIFSQKQFLSSLISPAKIQNELVLYQTKNLKDVIKPYKPNIVKYFSEVCGNVYFDRRLTSSDYFSKPEKYSYRGYFPPYNSQLDPINSKRLDLIMENNGSFHLFLKDTEFYPPYEAPILDRVDVSSRIPSMENLTDQDIQLLKLNDYHVSTNKEFLNE